MQKSNKPLAKYNVALVVPCRTYAFGKQFIPLAFGVLSAVAPDDWETKVFFADEWNEIIAWNPMVVGFSGVTANMDHISSLCQTLKKMGIFSVIGGIHATFCPEECLQIADTIIIGEAEEIWPVFLNDFKNNKFLKTYKGRRQVDLNATPLTDYTVMRGATEAYSSRGCPHDCAFCSVGKYLGKKVRKLAEYRLLEHLDSVPDSHIGFCDENSLYSNNQAKVIMRVMREVDKSWSCTTTMPMLAKQELVQLAKESKCTELYVGYEGGDSARLAEVDKSWAATKNPKALFQAIRNLGIKVVTGVILGFDSDTEKSILRLTYDLVNRGPDHIDLSILTPLPGTRLRKRFVSESRILPGETWARHDMAHCLFKPKNFSPSKLERLYWNLYKQFYSAKACENRAKLMRGKAQDLYLHECDEIRLNILQRHGAFDGRTVWHQTST